VTAVTVLDGQGAELSQVGLSHLSIEVGHLYMEDLALGRARIAQVMRSAAPWLDAARTGCAEQLGIAAPRISTCFMIDDYFGTIGSPDEVIPDVLDAAKDAGISIDYLAREAGCASGDGIEPARLVLGRMVPDPPRGSSGARPSVFDSGWLCNGERTPVADATHAMRDAPAWRPPIENGVNRHAIFVDVQLWDEADGVRTWSCPYLASVWQLLRLGLLRHDGVAVGRPCPIDVSALPSRWTDLPPIGQLNPNAKPFTAYRTMSILDTRFQPIELAVRTILSQVDVGSAVQSQIRDRAQREGVPIAVPVEVVERMAYVFVSPPWR
jgi:hypothetical protein